jgi:putative transposase
VQKVLTLEVKNDQYIFHGRSQQITKDKNALLAPFGKMVLNYGVVLNALPTEIQESNFSQQIGNARFVRNDYLTQRNALYQSSKKTLSVADYKKNHLPKLKASKPFLMLSDKFALEDAIERVDDAYNHFYNNIKNGKTGKQAGFPKFASKYKPNGNSYTTKFTNNNIELKMVNNLPYVKLPKIGLVRIVMPVKQTINSILPDNTRITSATIRRFNGEWTISLQLERIVNKPEELIEVKATDVWASDMGIKDFAIYGNKDFTNKEDNPRFIKLHEKRLRRLQKSLSRKKLRSKNWIKAKSKVSKEQRKIKNQRLDFHHKLSHKIVDSCNVFICEDLNIQGMVKNHKLAKQIVSVGWGQFLNFVQYKLERKGGLFIKVNRFYASSKLCNKCGYKKEDLTLKDRHWVCPNCGTNHDRDENSKFNLIDEGIRILETEYGIKVVA